MTWVFVEIPVQYVSMENLVSSPFLLRLSIPFHPWLKSPHCQGTRFTRVLASQPVGDAQRRVWGARAERLLQTYRGWLRNPAPVDRWQTSHYFGWFSTILLDLFGGAGFLPQLNDVQCRVVGHCCDSNTVVPIFADELLPCSYCAKMMFNEFNESTWWINHILIILTSCLAVTIYSLASGELSRQCFTRIYIYILHYIYTFQAHIPQISGMGHDNRVLLPKLINNRVLLSRTGFSGHILSLGTQDAAKSSCSHFFWPGDASLSDSQLFPAPSGQHVQTSGVWPCLTLPI